MVKLAGEIAKVGGWKIDLDTLAIEITPVTASLYDAPELRKLTLAEAFAFYTAESSTRLQAAIAQSIETGNGFDETLTLVSRSGRKRTVRAMDLVEIDQDVNGFIGLKGAMMDIV